MSEPQRPEPLSVYDMAVALTRADGVAVDPPIDRISVTDEDVAELVGERESAPPCT